MYIYKGKEKVMNVDVKFMSKLIEEFKDDYRVEDCYRALLALELSKEFGIYFRYVDGKISCEALGFAKYMNEFHSYESLRQTIENMLGSDYNDVKLKDAFDYDFSYSGKGLRFDEDKFGAFRFVGRFLSPDITPIFHVMLYVLAGEVPEDFREANAFEDKAQKYSKDHQYSSDCLFENYKHLNTGNWIDLGKVVDKFFDGISLKIFKNGNGLIKGLTNEEWERALYLQDVCTKKLR